MSHSEALYGFFKDRSRKKKSSQKEPFTRIAKFEIACHYAYDYILSSYSEKGAIGMDMEK